MVSNNTAVVFLFSFEVKKGEPQVPGLPGETPAPQKEPCSVVTAAPKGRARGSLQPPRMARLTDTLGLTAAGFHPVRQDISLAHGGLGK